MVRPTGDTRGRRVGRTTPVARHIEPDTEPVADAPTETEPAPPDPADAVASSRKVPLALDTARWARAASQLVMARASDVAVEVTVPEVVRAPSPVVLIVVVMEPSRLPVEDPVAVDPPADPLVPADADPLLPPEADPLVDPLPAPDPAGSPDDAAPDPEPAVDEADVWPPAVPAAEADVPVLEPLLPVALPAVLLEDDPRAQCAAASAWADARPAHVALANNSPRVAPRAPAAARRASISARWNQAAAWASAVAAAAAVSLAA